MPRPRASALQAAALLAAILASPPDARAAGTPPRPAKAAVDSAGAVEPDSSGEGARAAEARTSAEKRYKEGYALASEATKDLAAGRPELARKKFGKARKLFERATQLDARYYQAWNMLGFCARQCGDLKAAFAAYGTCLEIEPEYEEAHEYLGETYLKAGEIQKAKAELAWLRSRKSKEADALARKIARAEAGGADTWNNAGEWRERAADSTAARPK